MALIDVFANLGVSDFTHDTPRPADWALNQTWHVVLGIGAAVLSRRCKPLAWFMAAGWIARELTFDIPGAGFAPVVEIDSAIDLGFGWLGFRLARDTVNRPAEPL